MALISQKNFELLKKSEIEADRLFDVSESATSPLESGSGKLFELVKFLSDSTEIFGDEATDTKCVDSCFPALGEELAIGVEALPTEGVGVAEGVGETASEGLGVDVDGIGVDEEVGAGVGITS